MKWFVCIACFTIAFIAIITGGVCYNSYINRDKEHVYTAEEIYSNECAKRGGNTVIKEGWNDAIHTQDYQCEVNK